MNKTRIASAAFAAIVVLALLTCFCACTQAQELPDWAFDSLYAADASRAEGSDVRVMSVNMLVHMESWGGEPFFRYGEELAMTDHYPIFCYFVL